MIKYGYRKGRRGSLCVRLKTPISSSPGTGRDWKWIDVVLGGCDYFRLLPDSGGSKAPRFLPKRKKTGEQMYLLDFSLEIEGLERRRTGKVLAVGPSRTVESRGKWKKVILGSSISNTACTEKNR